MIRPLFALCLLLTLCPLQAQPLARYDGGTLTTAELEAHARRMGMPGLPDAPEQRAALLRELALTDLLARQALADGLHLSPEFASLWAVEQQHLLVERLLREQSTRLFQAPERFYRLRQAMIRARLGNGLRVRADEEAVRLGETLRQHWLQASDAERPQLLARPEVELEALLLADTLAQEEVRWALQRQAEPAAGNLWRLQHYAPLQERAVNNGEGRVHLQRYAIVQSTGRSAPKGWRHVRYGAAQGYLPNEILTPLPPERGVSHLLYLPEGVLLVWLEGVEQLGREEYVQRLAETRFRGQPAEAARNLGDNEWLALYDHRRQAWWAAQYAAVGLPQGEMPLPAVDADAVVHRHGDFVLTRRDLDQYLAWLGLEYARQGRVLEYTAPGLYPQFLRHQVLLRAARVQGLAEAPEVLEWQRRRLLADMVRRQWVAELSVPEQELAARLAEEGVSDDAPEQRAQVHAELLKAKRDEVIAAGEAALLHRHNFQLLRRAQ